MFEPRGRTRTSDGRHRAHRRRFAGMPGRASWACLQEPVTVSIGGRFSPPPPPTAVVGTRPNIWVRRRRQCCAVAVPVSMLLFQLASAPVSHPPDQLAHLALADTAVPDVGGGGVPLYPQSPGAPGESGAGGPIAERDSAVHLVSTNQVVAGIPITVLAAYQHAADQLAATRSECHLPLPLLAAIGKVESNHARGGAVDPQGTTLGRIVGPQLNGGDYAAISDTDDGRWDGDQRWDRAVGPMQFIPSTWQRWGVDGNGDGVSDPNNVFDATLAAGNYLCAAGGNLATSGGLNRAVLAYNHSTSYLNLVLAWMRVYSNGASAVPDTNAASASPTSGSNGQNASTNPPPPNNPPPPKPQSSAPTPNQPGPTPGAGGNQPGPTPGGTDGLPTGGVVPPAAPGAPTALPPVPAGSGGL